MGTMQAAVCTLTLLLAGTGQPQSRRERVIRATGASLVAVGAASLVATVPLELTGLAKWRELNEGSWETGATGFPTTFYGPEIERERRLCARLGVAKSITLGVGAMAFTAGMVMLVTNRLREPLVVEPRLAVLGHGGAVLSASLRF